MSAFSSEKKQMVFIAAAISLHHALESSTPEVVSTTTKRTYQRENLYHPGPEFE